MERAIKCREMEYTPQDTLWWSRRYLKAPAASFWMGRAESVNFTCAFAGGSSISQADRTGPGKAQTAGLRHQQRPFPPAGPVQKCQWKTPRHKGVPEKISSWMAWEGHIPGGHLNEWAAAGGGVEWSRTPRKWIVCHGPGNEQVITSPGMRAPTCGKRQSNIYPLSLQGEPCKFCLYKQLRRVVSRISTNKWSRSWNTNSMLTAKYWEIPHTTRNDKCRQYFNFF